MSEPSAPNRSLSSVVGPSSWSNRRGMPLTILAASLAPYLEETTMPPVQSTMLALGTKAPDFELPAPDGSMHSLDACAGHAGLLVAFICNHCPYVKHVYEELARLGHELPSQGIGMVCISANDVERYPDDGPEKMAETAEANGWSFPYLYDQTQEIAKAYGVEWVPSDASMGPQASGQA